MKKDWKMTKLWITLAAAAASLAALGCGRIHGDTNDSGSGGDGKPPVVGTWDTGCSAGRNAFIPPKAKSVSLRYLFDADGTLTSALTTYSDVACKEPLTKLSVAGRYTVGEASKDVVGAFDLDLKGGEATDALLDPGALVINPCNGGFYLYGTVSCGTAKDAYQIIKLNGKTMQLGDDTAAGVGTSAAARPKMLKDTVYSKVE